MRYRNNLPRLLIADDSGKIREHPRLLMVGGEGTHLVKPRKEILIRLPAYSKLFYLPGCRPIGYDPENGKYVVLRRFGRRPVHAVSAFLPPGYLRLMLPAADWSLRSDIFPLWAYSAVGLSAGEFVAPALILDRTTRWDPENYDDEELIPATKRLKRLFPANRLLDHLVNCAHEYHCFAAKNLFLERWEAPLPVSRSCNMQCLGCLSLQPPTGCVASHERIAFTPSVDEVSDLAIHHLERAEEPIVSFGQGCEGEPLMEAELIEQCIRRIRAATGKGVINLNTNGYDSEKVLSLARAGLDSIRVSMASARPDIFSQYHKPADYTIEEVLESIRVAGREGVYTMINYLVFPGVTDREEEITALAEAVAKTNVRFIHLKNLNIDPDYYLQSLDAGSWEKGFGMAKLPQRIKESIPDVELGYFNRWRLPEDGKAGVDDE